jgi:hypothetical protein
MDADPLAIAEQVASVLDRLNLSYAVGGAVGGSIFGEPRATNDLDLVVQVDADAADALFDGLEAIGFYVPRTAAATAIVSCRSFNVLHRETMLKVDMFVAGRTPLDVEELRRRRLVTVSTDPLRRLYVASAEDLVLQKLLWFKDGGGVSDRQWRDVLGLLKVQGTRLDRGYFATWAGRLGVTELLARALTEAGIVHRPPEGHSS